MVAVAVVHEVVKIVVERAGLHLAVFVGDGDDLMFRKLYGTSFVYVDMARTDTDDALVLVEH